jgi:phospholipase C
MAASGLAAVDHIVVLMLENRSFDHLLGFLYTGAGNVSPAGNPFEGLTGHESCPGTDGAPVPVWRITSDTPTPTSCPAPIPGRGGRRPTHSSTVTRRRRRRGRWRR